MNTGYCTAILICTVPAVVAEILALVFPQRVLGLLKQDSEHAGFGAFQWLLLALSVFYLADLGLMFFSGDDIFKLSSLVIVSLGVTMWTFRSLVMRLRAVLMIESTFCLVLLVNVLLSVLRMNRLWVP